MNPAQPTNLKPSFDLAIPGTFLNGPSLNESSSLLFQRLLRGQVPSLSHLENYEIRDLTLQVFSLGTLPPMVLTAFKVEQTVKQNLLQSVNVRYGEKTKNHLLELFQPNQPIQGRVFRDVVEEIIKTNDVETAEFLFVKGFISSVFIEFLNLLNDEGETALISAISAESPTEEDLQKNIEITLLLINLLKGNEEALDVSNDYGETPLMLAAGDARKIKIFEALVEADAPINSEEKKEITPLMKAVKVGNIKALNFLIQREKSLRESPEDLSEHTDFNAQGPDGKTALMLAVLNNKREAVQALIQEDFVNLEIPDSSGHTPLQALFQDHIIRDNFEAFASLSLILLQHGANPNRLDPDSFTDQTLLMKACENLEAIDVVKKLISKKANMNAKDLTGSTALMEAVLKNNKEAVRLLLESGADQIMENCEHDTALDLANFLNSQDGCSQEIVDLLEGNSGNKQPSYKRGQTLLNGPTQKKKWPKEKSFLPQKKPRTS